jgi:hypothetical protein
MHGIGKKMYRVLVGKPKGKSPLESLRHRWEHGIKMNLRETCWWGVEGIHLAQDRDQWWALVKAVMKLQVLVSRSWLELLLQLMLKMLPSSPNVLSTPVEHNVNSLEFLPGNC